MKKKRQSDDVQFKKQGGLHRNGKP
jgi:hypothetical protein